MQTEKKLFKNDKCQSHARRQFVRFLMLSPLLSSAGLLSLDFFEALAEENVPIVNSDSAANVLQFEDTARIKLTPETFNFIADGSDDMKTLKANREAFDQLQIRVRRLINVSNIDTSVEILGEKMETPIILAPIGGQQQINPDGELASARAAASRKHLFMVSTVSSYGIGEIASAGKGPLWFQLYPSPGKDIMKQLLQKAEEAGSKVVVLTVDGPTLGNRERQASFYSSMQGKERPRLGNFEGLKGKPQIGDSSLTWGIVGWLKSNTNMKVMLKGIVTHEDAKLCLENGVDGIIVSNHGGRQEESNRATMECLPEIVEAIKGRIPVMIDGGFRRGTDIFKALALGANAICIGRPYIWGLASFGEKGVEKVLDILRAELVRTMKFAGTTSIGEISTAYINRKNY